LRLSAGRGQRTANIFAENSGLLASSRRVIIRGGDSDKPYGLDQEIAWNYGLNLTQLFTLDYREGSISFDFYRTDFVNQIVVDVDQSPRQVVFYNLDGKSYSNSFQAQLDYELIKRLDLRLAYRWFDVMTTYDGRLRQKPLISAHRAFVNLAYESRNYWKFDLTLNWQGKKRIPFTSRNPDSYRLSQIAPAFFLLNGQITKTWQEKFDVYLGVENLLNFTQENPILASDDPFGRNFDSSLIWGPIFGRNVYLGLRYSIK
ncbi:MAG: TonB-dependent receptor, partial [Bacteroidota bacterium]